MGKIKRIRVKQSNHRSIPGSRPGVLELQDSDLKPRIFIYSYDDDHFHESEISHYAEIDAHFAKFPSFTHWINIQGLGDEQLFKYLEKTFEIHPLILEDISGSRQRPKLDESEHYLFAISRSLFINSDREILNEQLSFLLMPHVLISFQQSYNSSFEPVINRLRSDKGNIRTSGSSYMLYSLMDVVVDNYFELINSLGEELETLEELMYRRPQRSMMYDIQSVKRAMIIIRRAVWPERDKINDLIRSDSPLILPETKTFLRDTYDHTMQVIDLVESYRDITTGLIDMNLSFISNRMNEIMKVLTIISSIFIPLTFIVGIYGMNFAYQDPVSGKILPKNMPELYSENGYVYVLAAMFVIAVLQVIYFWQKGWLRSRE